MPLAAQWHLGTDTLFGVAWQYVCKYSSDAKSECSGDGCQMHAASDTVLVRAVFIRQPRLTVPAMQLGCQMNMCGLLAPSLRSDTARKPSPCYGIFMSQHKYTLLCEWTLQCGTVVLLQPV